MAGPHPRLLVVTEGALAVTALTDELRHFFPRLEVDTVESGQQCLESLVLTQVDAVVIDYDPAERDRLEFLAAMVREFFRLPVVLMARAWNEQVAVSALKASAFDCVYQDGANDGANDLARAVGNAIEHKTRTNAKDATPGAASTGAQTSPKTGFSPDRRDASTGANLVHELRTSLGSIRGYADLMKRACLGEITSDQKSGLEMILKNADRMGSVVNDLFALVSGDLDSAAFDAAGLDVTGLGRERSEHVQGVFLKPFLDDVVTAVIPNLVDKKIEISLSFPDEEPVFETEERRLHHLLVDLSDELIRTIKAGGKLVLALTLRDGLAEIAYRTGDAALPEELAEAIRAPVPPGAPLHNWWRLAEALSRQSGRLVIGRGAGGPEVCVELPARVAERGGRMERRGASMRGATSGTILVVDNDPDCLDLLDLVLSGDYRILRASSGRKIFDVLEGEPVDLILMDIFMSDLNGVEACRKIKGNPDHAHIPIYMISASPEESQKQLSLEAGASGFLEKPFDTETLVSFVRRIFPTPVAATIG